MDCLLAEFAGDNLRTILQMLNDQWNTGTERVLRKYFVAMVFMCQQGDVSNLEWAVDFYCGNICFKAPNQSHIFFNSTEHSRQTPAAGA
eukprot:s815_g26.t1